jgi:hypothetical protein
MKNLTIKRHSADWMTNLCEACGERGTQVFKIRIKSPMLKDMRTKTIWLCLSCIEGTFRMAVRTLSK